MEKEMNKNNKYLAIGVLVLLLAGGVIWLVSRYRHITASTDYIVRPVEPGGAVSQKQPVSPQGGGNAMTGAQHSVTTSAVVVSGNSVPATQRFVKASQYGGIMIAVGETNAVSLSGRVVDDEGNPKGDVLVSFPLGGCKTDSNGEFHFDTIMPLLGKGRDRGTFNIIAPGSTWHLRKKLDIIPSGIEQAVSLGNIRLPSPDGCVKGRIFGDQNILPQTITMISEDGSIIGFIGILNSALKQRSFPEGIYTISNCNLAGHPEPTNALPQSYRIVLRKGEVTEVDFRVSRNTGNSK